MRKVTRSAGWAAAATLAAVIVGFAPSAAVARKEAEQGLKLPAAPKTPMHPASFRLDNGMRGWQVMLPERKRLATPAVVGGRVFVGGGFGSYGFYALDAATGQTDWQLKTTDDGPTAAVVEDGIAVYNTESCTVEAVDAKSGKRLWSRNLGDPLMSQPAVANHRVFMVYPGEGADVLICMAVATGKTVWKQPLDSDAISAPVIQDGYVFVSTLAGTMYCFDAGDGTRQWKELHNATSAPWIENGEVYSSTRESNIGGIVVPPGQSMAEVASHILRYPGDEQQPLPVEHYEGFLVLDHHGKLLRKGGPWRTAGYLSATRNARTAAGTKAHANDSAVGFASAPEGAKIGQAQANLGANTISEVWGFQGSRPLVLNGRNYNAQNATLQCLNAATNKPIWQLKLAEDASTARTLTPPSLAASGLYFGTSRGEIGCADAWTGKLRWLYKAGAPVLFQPAVVAGRVYFSTEAGAVICLDTGERAATGWAMWGGGPGHDGAMKAS